MTTLLRFGLPLLPSLLLASGLAAQSPKAVQSPKLGTPEPTRWTPKPQAIEPQQSPAASAPAFPMLNPSQPDSDTNTTGPSHSSRIAGPAITVTSSLAVVLGLFAGLVWLTRRFGSRTLQAGALPGEIVQSLGSTTLDSRTKVILLRCGTRILVLAQSPTGIQPLSEITDSEEVHRLTAACLGESHQSFMATLESFEKEPADSGFVGAPAATAAPPRSRLFATA
ncbi:MAG: flagellar biosynthetic protein FliO [Pirellulales bacterium]|nr:flagellar biosynthetic protein FliO [Pirellulales bacterium]